MTIFLILLGVYLLGFIPSWLMFRKCLKDIKGFEVHEADLVLMFFPLANILGFFFIAYEYTKELGKDEEFINKIFFIKGNRSK